MKKYALSALAAALMSGVIHADTMTLFTDPKTGQVFTTPGEGRVEMGDFVDAKSVDMGLRENASSLAEYQDAMKKYTPVASKSKKLEFSGLHYFGWTYANPTNTTVQTTSSTSALADSSGFESRRNYVEVKGYFNDKDYFRVTLDTTKELGSTTTYATTYVKYAYLYLNDVLPYTGVEVGIAHRPWIDYEEHNSWNYRSFNKVVLEEKGTATEAGVDLINSADLGVNFKTKTDLFSSEIGIFNGEGYHADKAANNQQNSRGMSAEWRLTGHLIGSGEKVGKTDRLKDTYAHISTYGMFSTNHKDNNVNTLGTGSTGSSNSVGYYDGAEYNRTIAGLHMVYNQPEFLIAAQMFTAKDKLRDETMAAYANSNVYTNTSGSLSSIRGKNYKGYSINTEYRPMKDWTIIGRYDDYKIDSITPVTGAVSSTTEGNKKIFGLAYKYSKNVSFIASAKFINEKSGSTTFTPTAYDKDVYMLTTEVKW